MNVRTWWVIGRVIKGCVINKLNELGDDDGWADVACSYPAVHNRADIDISSPMKIHGKKGSNGTYIRGKQGGRRIC